MLDYAGSRALSRKGAEYADLSGLSDRHRRGVASYRAVDAETDMQALRAAQQFVDGCDVEIWLLDRKIGRLECAKNRN